jgi:murein DD-endopeptidase MepM/ murein hydrolase activator NlpD
MPDALEDPVVVDFPLRGEGWMAVTTPATRVPSHGVDLLGQRYAYDLLRVDQRKGVNFHPTGQVRGLLFGGRTRKCYAWGAPIHCPFDAEVVRAVDGIEERAWIYPIREALRAIWTGLTFRPSRLRAILGNHVILRSGDVYAGFAHLAPGTVEVVDGQRVGTGDVIGRIGHTGNSTSPHLHFQLMDSADLMSAQGLPCAFRTYEVERDGAWVTVTNGIPGRRDRIRSIEPETGHSPQPG